MIKFLDLKKINSKYKKQFIEIATKEISSGVYIGGDSVRSFEDNFANYTNSKFCIGVGNGLEALRIGLVSAGISKGDEVIVPSNTFIATWLAVSEIGAVPIAVDIDESSKNISPLLIQKSITKKTKCVIGVDLYGRPCEAKDISKICKQNNLIFIQDSAQAHGAIYKDKKIGHYSDICAWSFYPGKNLGALGDAGAITTNNASYAKKIRALSNYGSKKKYEHIYAGMNSRLDPLQASFLNLRLQDLNLHNSMRVQLAQTYDRKITNPKIVKPEFSKDFAWHLYVIHSEKRQKIIEALADKDIEIGIHYPKPPAFQKAYAAEPYNDKNKRNSKLAKKYSQMSLSLPIGPHLSRNSVSYIADVLNSISL